MSESRHLIRRRPTTAPVAPQKGPAAPNGDSELQRLWDDRSYGGRSFGRWPCSCFDIVPQGTFTPTLERHWNDGELDVCPKCKLANPDR